jgi:YD repeat-containing protein
LVGGEEATNESAGSGSNQIVTDRTYYTSTAAVDQGSLSYPRLATTTGGAWEAIEYYSAVFSGDELLDTSYKTGVVKKRFRPFLTTQAPSPTADLSSFTAGEVTSFEYSDDYFTKIWGLHYRPTKIETKVDGTVTRLITQTYADSSIQVESVSRPVVTLTRTDKSSSSSTHVQIIKYFREDTPDLFLRKQIHSVERADGTKDSYIYERGTYLNDVFTVSIGAASRISVVHGTTNTSSTTACPSPGTYELDPVFLVAGMSTKESVIRDEYARVRRRETYVFDAGDWRLITWESVTYSRANQVTSVQTSNGLVNSRTYTGELLDSETDYNGIKSTFLYDSSGRLISSTKVNGEISNFEYDADGRVVKSSASSTRTTETISSTQEFDTADAS